MRSILLWGGLLIVCSGYAQSKVPLLEHTISININQERLDVALKRIAQQGRFVFSYNPSIVETDKIVSYNFVNQTIREVLDQLFKGTIQYKERGKYIILTKAEVSSSRKEPKVFTGYVIDESTGKRLRNVSVYDPVSLSSAVTDAYGYFQITIDKPTGEEIRLAVNKLDYTDTLVVVPSSAGRLLNIPLKNSTEKIATLADSLGKKIKRFWLSAKGTTEQAINMQNIDDTLYRKTQVSLFPFVGTNGKLSGNVINDYSFNIYGGYSLGVRKFEFAGMFNIERGDVQGTQFAGLFNTVWGKRKGFQMAGLFNVDRDSSGGTQLAGLINVNMRGSPDFAGAGLYNFSNGDSRVAMAGLGNVTVGRQSGTHLAGLFNVATQDSGPAQLAGLFNFTAGGMHGAQVGGLFNFAAKDVHGAQVAGLLNIAAKEVKGAQVGGIINYATRVKGTQVGLINIVGDSIEGVPVGFLTFVRKGYHKIEISADEIFYTNVAFRTGVRKFHNIFSAGAKPSTFGDDATFWSIGYGFGTAPRLNDRLFLNIDLTANEVLSTGDIDNGLSLLNKFYVGVDWQVARHFSVIAGATLNGYFSDADTPESSMGIFTDYKPHLIRDHTYSNDVNLKMWFGAKVGIRFL